MDSVDVQEKEVVCKLGMTGVIKKEVMVNEATLTGRLKKDDFPKIREPVPQLRFGEDIKIQAPLPQPILRVNLMVNIEFYKMTELRSPPMTRIKSALIKLTADSGV